MTSTLTSRPSTPRRTDLKPCRNVLHPLQASVSKMVRTKQIHKDVNCCCSDLKTLSASLAVCEGKPPGTGRFHSQRANFDQLQYVYSCRLEKQLLKKTVDMLVIGDTMSFTKVEWVRWPYSIISFLKPGLPYLQSGYCKYDNIFSFFMELIFLIFLLFGCLDVPFS